MELPDAPVREADVAKQLGMQRKALSDLRKEVLADEDYFREEGNKPEPMRPVWLRPSGVAKISAHLGLKTEEVAPKKIASAPDGAEIRTLTVIRVLPRNPYLVEAVAEGGEKVIMRVKDSSKWMKGMKCEARTGGSYTKWWIPMRNPRYRGKF
jgi:hypothetical protein